MKKIIVALFLVAGLASPALSQDSPESSVQAQSLLDALRECNERQTALLAEQRALGENILHIRERINQININLLGIQNNTQQIIVAHGGVVKVADFFANNDKNIILGVVCLALFGAFSAVNSLTKGWNWLTTTKKAQ